ncbi:AraC family transcriptional regulator N-terminal domain-containing protein [Granulicella sp. L60]|uniref:AraC family transcriptional regulator N-terminal domain-containing protein n=1 Tax=Granulicella sp. L60 TaxID=1641866 RepID=UPI00131D35E4|nr:AraC family transcriptional regulator N-terminal domain-containing protein [Granulicella sp. L60]
MNAGINDSATSFEVDRQRLRLLLEQLDTEQGLTPTVLDGVKIARANSALPRHQVLYEPSIYIVASGRKTGFVKEHRFVYDQHNYLVQTVPLPFEVITELEESGPMLGISVHLDMSVVAELVSKMGLSPQSTESDNHASVQPSSMDSRMCQAAIRLVASLHSTKDALILGPEIIREIIYCVLSSSNRDTLVSALNQGSAIAKMQTVLDTIHKRYSQPIDTARSAEALGVSISTFHQLFKKVTGTSPVLYLRAVRLHKARLFIRYDGLGAAATAARVGYSTPSQFSRDFKSFFGYAPTQESVLGDGLVGTDGDETAFIPESAEGLTNLI